MKLMTAPPKKVALVSFYTFDPGCTKTWQFSTSSQGTVFTTTTTYKYKKTLSSKGNSAKIAEGIYYSSMDNLKERFKSYGMELLLPEEFLDTPEKTDYYNNFVVPHSSAGFVDFAKGMSLGSKENDLFGYMDGYQVFNIVAEPHFNYQKSGMLTNVGYGAKVMDGKVFVDNSDDKMVNALGYDLAKKLGVDAVVIVYATVYVPKESKIMLQNINMTMFGPNPIQLGESDKKPWTYNKGVFYCGTRFQPNVAILSIKKKDPTTSELNFKGFNEVLGAMATKMGLYLTGKED